MTALYNYTTLVDLFNISIFTICLNPLILLEKHGEHIWMESEPGKGSRFIFTLAIDSGIQNQLTPD